MPDWISIHLLLHLLIYIGSAYWALEQTAPSFPTPYLNYLLYSIKVFSVYSGFNANARKKFFKYINSLKTIFLDFFKFIIYSKHLSFPFLHSKLSYKALHISFQFMSLSFTNGHWMHVYMCIYLDSYITCLVNIRLFLCMFSGLTIWY